MYNNQNKYKNNKEFHKYGENELDNKNLRRNTYLKDFYNEGTEPDEPEDNKVELNEETENNTESTNVPPLITPSISKPKFRKLKLKNIKAKLKLIKNFFMFLLKHPYLLFICLIILFIISFVILMLVTAISRHNNESGVGGGSQGYFDLACNFNKTVVNYEDSNGSYKNLSLEEFIVSTTYAYIKDENYSDETIKTLLIILKTNALSQGKYNNLFQKLELKDFAKGYIPDEEVTKLYLKNNISDIYEATSEEIYVSASYKGTIKSLSESDILPLSDATLEKIDELDSTKNYNEILDELYNSNNEDKKIYKIADNCTYYSLTDNDAFWWPVGSSKPTTGNIYGGTPMSVKINSYFGYRDVDGDGQYDYHKGIDIDGKNNVSVSEREVVIASKAGTVTEVTTGCDNSGGYGNKCGRGYGNHLIVNHGDGTETYYAHLYPNSITVKKGDSVKQGEKLALIGNSGSSTGDHLHFEIRVNGSQVDPLNHISADNPRPQREYSLTSVDDSVKTPTETKREICRSLKSSGYSDNAVAGMLVNIEAEGSFLLNNLEGCYEKGQCCFGGTYGYCKHPEIGEFGSDDAYTKGVDSGAYPKSKFINDRAGYGLIQWTSSGRKGNLYDTAKNENKSIASLSVQLGYLLVEVQKPAYSITKKYITGNYSAYEIAKNFCLNFESPRDEESVCPNRASSNIDRMLNYVKNNCN